MSPTRIHRIKKIDNYRIFQNWKPSGGVEFTRVNLIYGQNGSGKSTLANLMLGCATSNPEAAMAGVVLDVEDGAAQRSEVTADSAPEFWKRLRVFNKDFVLRNLAFGVEGGPQPRALLTIGEISVDVEKQLNKLRSELDDARSRIESAKKAVKSADNALGKRLTEVAKSVVDSLHGTRVSEYNPRRYNKSKVKLLLDSFEKDPIVLNGVSMNLGADIRTATGEAMDPVALAARNALLERDGLDEARRLLDANVVSETIEELKGHPDRSNWVQTGISLHEALGECLFCGNPLTEDRCAKLAAHFDDSFKRLQRDIDALIERLSAAVKTSKNYLENLPDDSSVYPELKVNLQQARIVYREEHETYSQAVEKILVALKEKKNNPFGRILLESGLMLSDPDAKELEKVVVEHAEKIRKHDEEARAAARRVELYHVKNFFDEYRERQRETKEKAEEVERLKDKAGQLEHEITRMENVDGDPVPGAKELTGYVARLLGRDELTFSTASDGKHYIIERDGISASNLSEGEQTAIALLYFLVSVREDKNQGDPPIVVIDDPVSSLDQGVLFGASAHMWSELVENQYVSQFFLMTHNFDLFRHWLIQLEARQRHEDCDYRAYEMTPDYTQRGPDRVLRRPRLKLWETDKERIKVLRSEYHFLFSRAAHAVVDRRGDESPADQMNELALMPNAARRMLEAFLSFKCPGKMGSFHVAVQEVMDCDNGLDASVRTRVERYLHAYSHFDGGDISQPLKLTEATTVLRSLFELMHHVDPGHVSSMCEALGIDKSGLLGMPATKPVAGDLSHG